MHGLLAYQQRDHRVGNTEIHRCVTALDHRLPDF